MDDFLCVGIQGQGQVTGDVFIQDDRGGLFADDEFGVYGAVLDGVFGQVDFSAGFRNLGRGGRVIRPQHTAGGGVGGEDEEEEEEEGRHWVIRD